MSSGFFGDIEDKQDLVGTGFLQVFARLTVSAGIHNGLLWLERFHWSFLFILYVLSGQFTLLFWLFAGIWFLHIYKNKFAILGGNWTPTM